MSGNAAPPLSRHVRRLAAAASSDEQLLADFLARRSDQAFAAHPQHFGRGVKCTDRFGAGREQEGKSPCPGAKVEDVQSIHRDNFIDRPRDIPLIILA